MTEVLSADQIAQYDEQGYLVLERHLPETVLDDIRAEIARFEEEARSMTASNDRLDLEDTHTPDDPRLRRIKLPHRISDTFRELMYSDHILAPARDLIGPDLRLILSLRDPAQRALSAWGHYLAHGELEPRLPFREAARYGGIIDMGFYGRHLERWLQHFPLQQFLVLSLERDIQRDPRGTLERCETFLGVPVTGGNPITARDRVFPGPTRRAVDGGLNISIPALGTVTVSDADLAWLDALYTEDQQLLERLLNPAH